MTEIMALSLAAALSALASWTSFSPTPSTIMSDIMIAGPRVAGGERDGRQHRQQDHQRVEHRVPEQLAEAGR